MRRRVTARLQNRQTLLLERASSDVVPWHQFVIRVDMKQARKAESYKRAAERRIRDEIEQLRLELDARKSMPRRAPRSVVLAYHALLERQYARLDGLDTQPAAEVH